jgi:hypothetical protein
MNGEYNYSQNKLAIRNRFSKLTDLLSDPIFLILFFLICLLYIWFSTHGRVTNLFGGYLLKDVFDELGVSLLQGSACIPFETIGFESYIVGGRSYTYFGPFPALLRIVLNFLFPGHFGEWTLLSCLTAGLFCLIIFSLIIQGQLIANKSLTLTQKESILCLSLIGFGIGSPILFLIVRSWIYHEAIIWGVLFLLIGIYFILPCLKGNNLSYFELFGLSLSAAFALLSRVPLGVVGYFFTILVLFKEVNYKSKDKFFRILLAILPALVGAGFQLWYNNERFDSYFKFKDEDRYIGNLNNEYGMREYKRTGMFNVKRIPIALKNYFGFRKDYFSDRPPFIIVRKADQGSANLYWYLEYCISWAVVSPWLIFSGLLVLIYLTLNYQANLVQILITSALSIPAIITLLFWCITQRYTADFIPLFIFLYLIFISNLGNEKFYKSYTSKFVFVNAALCVFSALTTFISTLGFAKNFADPADKYLPQIKAIFNFLNSMVKSFI